MCCALAFSSRSKQSHLLVPSLVSQFCSAKEEQQQEKGQIFQEEIQALRSSEGGSGAVRSHRCLRRSPSLPGCRVFCKELGWLQSRLLQSPGRCSCLCSCTEAFLYLRRVNVIKNSPKWEGSTPSPAPQRSCAAAC